MSLGQADGEAPSLPTMPTADISLGSAALIGILMALLRREKTSQGDCVDVAMMDTLMSWTPHILSSVVAEGRAPNRERAPLRRRGLLLPVSRRTKHIFSVRT